MIGAPDRRRNILGAGRLDAELDIGPRKFRGAFGVEKGLQRQDAAGLLARSDDQRGLVAVGGVDVAERVADACRRMQIDKAGVAGGLGIAIGHPDHGGLLQAEHIVDIVGPVAQERQFRRAGIAEHLADAERPQQLERRLLDGDRGSGGFGGFAGQCGVTSVVIPGREAKRSEPGIQTPDRAYAFQARAKARPGMTEGHHHVAVPFMVGWPAEFAVHSSMPAAVSLALMLNSLPSNSGCSPR